MLENFYEEYWHRRLTNLDDDELHLSNEHKVFEEFIGKVTNQKILEIGAGIGSFCKRYTKANTVFGVDISITALRMCMKNNISPVVSDAIALPFKSGSFDLVLIKDVLEHVPLPSLLIAEAERVLKDNGKIYIWVPNIAFIANRISLLLGRFNDYSSIDETINIIDCEHLHFFDHFSLKKLLIAKGLKISRIDYVPISYGLFLRGVRRLLKQKTIFATTLYILYKIGYFLSKSLSGLYIILEARKKKI